MTRKLGLALGGGGARGLAHLGVLLALDEAQIPISMIAGTSMGAAMGAAKAIGANLPMLRKVLEILDLNELLQVTDSTFRELQRIIGRSVVDYVRGGSPWRDDAAVPYDIARLRELFSLLTANKAFDDALIPFVVVTADLQTGERVILREGKLAPAITASTSIPGIFSPVARDGRYLIDGGILEKLPVDAVMDMGADAVLAVDTGAPLDRAVATDLDVLLQSQRATSQHLTKLQLSRARERLGERLLVLRPSVGRIRMFQFEHTKEAIQAGEQVVQAHLDDVRKILAEETAPSTLLRCEW